MGRPLKTVDLEQLENLAQKQWSIKEIAAHFRVSHDIIERRFADKIKEARQRGNAKLRDMLLQKAMQGNARVLIFLAKNYLGMTDRNEVTIPVAPATTFENPFTNVPTLELMDRLKLLEGDPNVQITETSPIREKEVFAFSGSQLPDGDDA